MPRSTAHLHAGQCWSVTLPDGRYACGRVLGLASADHADSTRTFRAGLLDCVGVFAPTAEAIAGRPIIAEGLLHVKSVAACGGEVIGWRALKADGIVVAEESATVATGATELHALLPLHACWVLRYACRRHSVAVAPARWLVPIAADTAAGDP